MIPYNPDEIEENIDIIKQFPELTEENLQKYESSEEIEFFKEYELKRSLLEYAKREVKKIDKLTNNIKRGEIVTLLVSLGFTMSDACFKCGINYNWFWDLRHRHGAKWEQKKNETWLLYEDLTEATGLYHLIWSKKHIEEQLNAANIDRRKTRTIIREMIKAGCDPYSTTDDSVTKYINNLKRKDRSKLATLQDKTCQP